MGDSMPEDSVIVPEMDNPPVFEWDCKTCTLRQFVESYHGDLPQILKVTSGYEGPNCPHSFVRNQILFVYAVKSQRRIIVKDSDGKHLSIPMKIAQSMRVLQNKQVVKKSVNSITSKPHWKHQCSPYMVEFTRGVSLIDGDSTEEKTCNDLGEMELVDCYDEQYLVANYIQNKGSMNNTVLVVPVYLLMEVVQASQICDGSADELSKWRAFYNKMVSHVDLASVKINSEINVLPNKNHVEQNDYAFIQPKHYIRTKINTPLLQSKFSFDNSLGAPSYENESKDHRRFQTSLRSNHSPATYANLPVQRGRRTSQPVPPLELPPRTPPRTPPRLNSGNVFVFPSCPVPSRSPQEEQELCETLQSFPEDRSVLSVSDVEKALNALNLDKYVPIFRQHFIDGSMLTSLNSQMLSEDFGFTKFETMKLIKFANGWSPHS